MRGMAIIILLVFLPISAAAQADTDDSGSITFTGSLSIGSAIGIAGLILREWKKSRDFKLNNGHLGDIKETLEQTSKDISKKKSDNGVIKTEVKNIKENCAKQQTNCSTRIETAERLIFRSLPNK